MANTDNPNGFTPVRHLTGGTIRMGEYLIASGESDASIFTGDLVVLDADGYIAAAAASDTNIVGVFAGCKYTNSSGDETYSKHWATGTTTQGSADATAYVYDDPDIVYDAQHDGTGAKADNGATFDILATAGSTTNGRSSMEIDTSTTGSGGQVRQIGLIGQADNAWGANATVECIINEHVFRKAAGATV
jgi:hypothetical protein